jgi:hypothetical protein
LGGDEGFLRDLDLAELAHPLLALFLLVEQLALAADVAAVAFGGHVLAQRAMVSRAITLPPMAAWIGILNIWRGIRSFSRSHMCAAAAFSARAAVDDHRERVDRLVVDQDLTSSRGRPRVAVRSGSRSWHSPSADRLQAVVEVEHHLVQRQS